jgi:hypothetical protein
MKHVRVWVPTEADAEEIRSLAAEMRARHNTAAAPGGEKTWEWGDVADLAEVSEPR